MTRKGPDPKALVVVAEWGRESPLTTITPTGRLPITTRLAAGTGLRTENPA